MKIKKLILGLVIMAALLISGCSSGADTNQSGLFGNSGGSTGSSSGGGVELEYGSGNIQPQKGVPFRMLFNVKNNQRHPVDVEFRATGFEWDFVSGDISGWKTGQRQTITAASDTGPGQYRIILDGNTLDGFTGDFSWNPIFKYCYQATSTFRQQVCVPNSFGDSCQDSVDSSITANGPLSIRIDNILPIGSDSIRLEFTVSNSKGGVVVNECFQEEVLNEYGNKFDLGEVRLGSTVGDCTPVGSDEHVINEGSAKFACDFSRSGSNDEPYRTQVVADITYNYQQQTSQSITVRDLSVN